MRYEGWSRGVRILGAVTPPAGVDEERSEFGKEVEEETGEARPEVDGGECTVNVAVRGRQLLTISEMDTIFPPSILLK